MEDNDFDAADLADAILGTSPATTVKTVAPAGSQPSTSDNIGWLLLLALILAVGLAIGLASPARSAEPCAFQVRCCTDGAALFDCVEPQRCTDRSADEYRDYPDRCEPCERHWDDYDYCNRCDDRDRTRARSGGLFDAEAEFADC